jgi:GntR family transcriptional regulator/MocR family aminotransferase
MELLELAGETKSWIVEDDYDSEFRFTAPPLPSLQSLDRFGKVIYVGTFSKVLFPSLRLGYVALPESLVEEFGRLKALMDDHGPLIDQATLALFLESGAFHSHIRRCRRAYGERQEVFLDHARKCGLPLEFPCTDGGMNLTGLFPDKKADDRKWSQRFTKAALDVPALSSYALKPGRPGLVFGFTAFEPKVIRNSLETVAALLNGKRVEAKH